MRQHLSDLSGSLLPAPRDIDERWQTDPLAWMVERMKIPENTLRWGSNPGYENHTWDGDEEPLVEICRAVGHCEWVAVESGTGTGKTFIAALMALWFLDVFENSRVVTIATKRDQLADGLWKEIDGFWPTFTRYNAIARMLSLEVRMIPPSKAWGMRGVTVGVSSGEKSATKARGIHGEYLLYITEETTGINPAIMEAVEQTLVGGPRNQWLAIGNPDHTSDPLHRMTERKDITSVRISGYDHPNVVCDDHNIVIGAVTKQSIARRLAKVDDDASDPTFQAMVRGICPSDTEFGLIKKKWLREARVRAVEMPGELRAFGPKALGVDVANSERGDKAAIAEGDGAMLDGVDAFQCPDAGILGSNVVARAKADGVGSSRIGVDATGVGASTVNEMVRLKYRPMALHGSAVPIADDGEEKFFNLRSQMWWQLRLDLQEGIIGISFDDEELIRELLTVRYEVRNGKTYVESKKDLVKRLGHSPDRADAVVYWNWIRVTRGPEFLIGRA
jgi:hypothetical protein